MKFFYTTLLCCAFLVLHSCKKTSAHHSAEASTTIDVASALSSAEMILTNPDNDTVGGFSLSPLRIYVDGFAYTSKSKPTKHKLYTNGRLEYEIKVKEYGFKLRDDSSTLLWKVKVYPDKIKVANNEENTDAFELKNYGSTLKIKKNDQELATVRLDGNTVLRNQAPIYHLSAPSQDQYAYGILAIPEIPEAHRIIILAALLNQQ